MKIHGLLIAAACILPMMSVPVSAAPRTSAQVQHKAQEHRPVLLISIDGLSPDTLFLPEDSGPKLPALRSLLRQGSYAERVVNVNPTVTNPNHTSLVTGVSPAIHGVYNNRPFVAAAKLPSSFREYSAIKVPTLWSAAKDAGLRTASIYWPVTQDAPVIDVNITAGDSHDDLKITQDALHILETHRPQLLTVHYVTHDSAQHDKGRGSAEGYAALVRIDAEVNKLVSAFRAQNPNGVVAIVSDHGFDNSHTEVNINTALTDAGFIKFADDTRSQIESWDAFSWYVGGSAMIVLRDANNAEMKAKVHRHLNDLAKRPELGIAAIHDRAALKNAGLSPLAEFMVELKPGYRVSSKSYGPLSAPYSGGTHGAYTTQTSRKDMHSSLILVGDGIAANRNLGVVDLRQIAPTLAGYLNVSLPDATQPTL